MLRANKSVFPDLLGKVTVSGATPAHCDDQAMALLFLLKRRFLPLTHKHISHVSQFFFMVIVRLIYRCVQIGMFHTKIYSVLFF